MGNRWWQLPHAACFVDPLFSTGLSVLTVAVDLFAGVLLDAFRDNDFAIERFQRVQDTVNGAFDHFDHVVTTSFDSFASYDLWNAWNRNWVMGNFLGTFGPLANLIHFLGSNDRSYLDRTTEPGRLGVLSNHLPEVKGAMMASSDDIGRALAGEITHAEASRRVFERLGALKFLPPYMGFGRPEQHAPSVFTLPSGARHVTWYRFQGDRKWRDYATFNLLTYAWQVAKFAWGQTRDNFSRIGRALRNVFWAGNDEWKHAPNALRAHAWVDSRSAGVSPLAGRRPRRPGAHERRRSRSPAPRATPAPAGETPAGQPRTAAVRWSMMNIQATPAWRGVFRDLPREHGFEPLRVEGTLPAQLRGVLYRCGPARFSIGGEPSALVRCRRRGRRDPLRRSTG
jgi:FADH2 O2-dependent halogenase